MPTFAIKKERAAQFEKRIAKAVKPLERFPVKNPSTFLLSGRLVSVQNLNNVLYNEKKVAEKNIRTIEENLIPLKNSIRNLNVVNTDKKIKIIEKVLEETDRNFFRLANNIDVKDPFYEIFILIAGHASLARKNVSAFFHAELMI